VSSDPATYGQLRVLNIRSSEQIDGPAIIDSEIKRKYAADFTLESQTGSKVRLGTLQAIPIGDSIVWVRPWYVQAEQTPIPQLSFVVVAYGDQIVRARTLEGALKLAFPDATINFTTTVGPLTPFTPGGGTGGTGGTGEDNGSSPDTSTPSTPQTVEELLAEANRLYADAKEALKEDPPDFATYDANVARAFELVTQAEQMAGGPPSSDGTSGSDPSTPPVSDTTASA
jgi:uncharacterized membrane protein (UPF0182 family)